MKLDRALIKSQAKQIIKGQIFALFLISLVVGLLSGGLNFGVTAGVDAISEAIDNQFSDSDYFDDFEEDEAGPNLYYFKDFTGSVNLVTIPGLRNVDKFEIFSNFGGLVSFILTPLAITLCGLYVMIIRGNKMKTGELFQYVFTKTFDANYVKKLLLYVLETIIIALMTCLFIIPGIIFYYRYYFADTIMADNPEMSAKDALKLSKEMTDGHKGELFALDFSFIGWALLFPLTLGLISIYVTPYYATTKALYYENFRIRCIQESAMPQLKFMTTDEINSLYNQQQEPAQVVVEEPKDTFGSGMDNNYYNGNL